MIPAVAQTLAKILADGTSLRSTEQIDFNPPAATPIRRSGLTVYCYNIQECQPTTATPWPETGYGAATWTQLETSTQRWFELSFLVSAWDYTALGEQQLLSEALRSLLQHDWIYSSDLAPKLQSGEPSAFKIASTPEVDAIALWQSLEQPLRPALYITVTVPVFFPHSPTLPRRAFRFADYSYF
jgi:hypothetical protein